MPPTAARFEPIVSILTGPFGPVQPDYPLIKRNNTLSFNPHRPFRAGATLFFSYNLHPLGVSILTGPFGPVQQPPAGAFTLAAMFQSSPALSGRCNDAGGGIVKYNIVFQSSPALSGRCNRWNTSTLAPKLRFNPHRPFRAGATYSAAMSSSSSSMFQSSPALSGRCNPSNVCGVSALEAFQSSPALSGRCNDDAYSGPRMFLRVSILTGPFGPVQRYPL